MNVDELRQEWNRLRDSLDDAAAKDVGILFEELSSFYRRLSENERELLDQVLAEGLEAADSKSRYDAMFLIREFKIGSLVSALRKLSRRLEGEPKVEDWNEREQVNLLIAYLHEDTDTE